jgi:pimeloyl-ACP methyl ester carboxylesterase
LYPRIRLQYLQTVTRRSGGAGRQIVYDRREASRDLEIRYPASRRPPVRLLYAKDRVAPPGDLTLRDRRFDRGRRERRTALELGDPASGGAGKRPRSRRRVLPKFGLATFVLALVLVVALGWSSLDAQARAIVVLSSVLETPVLTSGAEMLTGEPRLEESAVAGNPALVARPAGEGPWPALFLVNGAVPEGRELSEIRRLAEGLARAGHLVVVPDLPGLREGEITPETADETIEVARAVSSWQRARDGKVGLVGVSTGATLALLAAEEDGLEDRISVVAGVAPYADIETLLSIATTGHYAKNGTMIPYEAEPFLAYASARSLISALPPGEDRETLLSEMDRVERTDQEPLAGLRERSTEDLGAEAKSVVELLANEEPGRFHELYAGLPEGVRADLGELSPLSGRGRIGAPVELVSGPRDKYFPVSESYEILRIAPEGRVTVTDALDHAELGFSPGELPEFFEMNGFVVRSLREARSPDEAESQITE